MTHVTHMLDEFVDGSLSPHDREEVEAHVLACDSCQAALRAYDPVALDDLALPFEGGDGIRRTVRRAIGRTAVDAAALTVVLLVLGTLVSLFIVQPLLLNRSDRAAVAARAAYEAPMIFSPGVEVARFRIDWSLVGRTTTAEVQRPLGTSADAVGVISSEIGLFGVDPEWIPTSESAPVLVSDVLPGIDDGTVLTVVFDLPEPVSVDEAQSMADEPGSDVRLTWAGFDVESSVFGRVGYPLCRGLETPAPELFAASSASVGGSVTSIPPSVARALDSVRDALSVMASNDEVASAMSGEGPSPIRDLAEAMTEDRSVTSFVVTGPSPEVAALFDDLGVGDGQVLGVGFYSWGSPLCGR